MGEGPWSLVRNEIASGHIDRVDAYCGRISLVIQIQSSSVWPTDTDNTMIEIGEQVSFAHGPIVFELNTFDWIKRDFYGCTALSNGDVRMQVHRD
jgi:hypothetical protein